MDGEHKLRERGPCARDLRPHDKKSFDRNHLVREDRTREFVGTAPERRGTEVLSKDGDYRSPSRCGLSRNRRGVSGGCGNRFAAWFWPNLFRCSQLGMWER